MHKRRPSSRVMGMLLAVLAACALIGINEIGAHRSATALHAIEQATVTRGSLNRLMQQMLDAETGSRGFLLTGDVRYLEPYERATRSVDQTLEQLHQAYPEGSQEAGAVHDLSREVQRKLLEMELVVRMRREQKEDAWKFIVMSDVGKVHMDAIRGYVERLVAHANGDLEAHRAQVQHTLQVARAGIAAVTLGGLLAFALYLRQRRALEAANAREQQALAHERDQLEQQVRERTTSLAELATHLQQVREDERGHLARELHDELGALLTAAKLDVARLKSRLASAGPEVDERLHHLTDTLNRGIALKRRIIEDLRPSSLTNLGLPASLEILVREFSQQSSVAVETNLETVPLDESRQLTVYRLVQESLTNVAKYARARNVVVTLHAYPHVVEVSVRDDGQGFDPAQVRGSTHGLAGMRHRVEAAGGRLSVTSAPGRGTRVMAALPLEPPPVLPPAATADPPLPPAHAG